MPMLRRMFLNLFILLRGEYYFQEALGYHCVDVGDVYGTWGRDQEAFVFSKLKMEKLWPIEKSVDAWDEAQLFTMIEFLHDNVSARKEGWYHDFADCGWHGTTWDREEGRRRYREEINKILGDYEQGYVLSDKGEILQLAPRGLDTLVDEVVVSGDAGNIDNRVQGAISKFRRHGVTLVDKKDAIRTLGDVLEFLKKSGYTLPKPDDGNLVQIINKFDIRHHNPEQSADYSRDEFHRWIFYTLLASIDLINGLNFKHGLSLP